MGWFEPLSLGLLLGLKHAVEPDHLAAVSTLLGDSSSPRLAVRTGAAWGVGHGAAVVLFGGVLVAIGARVPTSLAIALDIGVVLMLVVLGVLSLRRSHNHHHAQNHSHVHAATSQRGDFRSSLVGFIHGASGTAAITLVCATRMDSRGAAMAFLALFAVGSIISMSAMSGILAAPLGYIQKRGQLAMARMHVAGAFVAFAAAVLVVVQIT